MSRPYVRVRRSREMRRLDLWRHWSVSDPTHGRRFTTFCARLFGVGLIVSTDPVYARGRWPA